MVIFLDFLIKKWLLIECILHFHFVSKFPNFLPTLAIHQVKMLKLSLPITYYRAAALLKLFIGNSQISIHGRRRGGGVGKFPSPPQQFWTSLIFLCLFPPLCRKFWVPWPIPPHWKKFSPCPILPSVEKVSLPTLYPPHHKSFSSLPYSPLCRGLLNHIPYHNYWHSSQCISNSEKFAIIPIYLPVLKIFIDTLSKSPIWKFILIPCPVPISPCNLKL